MIWTVCAFVWGLSSLAFALLLRFDAYEAPAFEPEPVRREAEPLEAPYRLLVDARGDVIGVEEVD